MSPHSFPGRRRFDRRGRGFFGRRRFLEREQRTITVTEEVDRGEQQKPHEKNEGDAEKAAAFHPGGGGGGVGLVGGGGGRRGIETAGGSRSHGSRRDGGVGRPQDSGVGRPRPTGFDFAVEPDELLAHQVALALEFGESLRIHGHKETKTPFRARQNGV